jgi:FkbM family methyltransferase
MLLTMSKGIRRRFHLLQEASAAERLRLVERSFRYYCSRLGLGGLLSAVDSALVISGTLVSRCLPARMWLAIREKGRVTKQLDYSGGNIRLGIDSVLELDIRCHSCEKETDTVDWIETWFQTGDVYYDVGANVGAYALVAARACKDVKVYAFEPGYVTYPQLCRNVYLNEVQESIVPLQVALSDKTGLTPFHYQNLETGGALHALGDPVDQKGELFNPVFTLDTPSFRLDDLVDLWKLPMPNHIKIDVDGLESEILAGSDSVLRNQGLRTVLLESEVELGRIDHIRSYLEERGLDLHRALPGSTFLFVRSLEPGGDDDVNC